MKPTAFILFIGIIFSSVNVISQNEINKLDSNGAPHGVWKKYYEGTQQIRYEGEFKHGKEVGEFRFYCEKCKNKPVAIKNFNKNNNIAAVEYFDLKGNTISKGEMDGKKRIGKWVTYHKNSKTPMVIETYKDGKLDGTQTTYYPDGSITEELNFSEGLKDGANTYYSMNGVAIKKLIYKDDKLEGAASYYDGHGNLIIEGSYNNDKKDGLWKYYKNGKIILQETFPKKNRE